MSLEALGLPDDADEAAVRARYKELAMAAHPDRGGTAEQFQQLTELRDEALKEVSFGHTIATARLQFDALRQAARGTTCPRCDGSGKGMSRVVGFREFKTVCKLCHGKGKIQ